MMLWFGKHMCEAAYNMKFIRISCSASFKMSVREYLMTRVNSSFSLARFLNLI